MRALYQSVSRALVAVRKGLQEWAIAIMTCPPTVRRALTRVVATAAAAALLTGLGGWAWVQQRFGTTVDDTRRRVEAATQARVAGLALALDEATKAVAADGGLVERAAGGDGPGVTALFAAVAAGGGRADVSALTVYGPDGTPVAWDGRPSALPASRLAGDSDTFLLQTPLGLRLVRTQPVGAAESARRVGVVVGEAALSGQAAGDAAAWATSIVPVGRAGAGPGADEFVVATPDGAALGLARVSPEAVAAARARGQADVRAWLWLVAALGCALAAAVLAEWRARTKETAARAWLTALLALGATGAGGLTMRASAVAARPWNDQARLVAEALVALALAVLAASVVVRWRVLRARRHPAAVRRVGLAVTALLAGAGVGLLAARHAAVVTVIWPDAVRLVRFALTPFETGQGVLAAGLVVLQSAVVLAAAVAVRAGLAWMAPRVRIAPWVVVVLAAGAMAAIAAATPRATLDVRLAAVALAAGMLATVAAFDRSSRRLRGGSQPERVLTAFLALAVPSAAAYPALAVWAAEARRAVVADDIAPQVAGQRQALQASLRTALADIDAAGDLPDLVGNAASAGDGPVPADAAFAVWSRTALATRRLTSSVELYDGAGRMASRFALNLPETASDQAWRETSCGWEVFEEVSPFFAEERRLLHAGRGVCVDGQIIGSVVVHVVLDYANLPFLAAQNPYVALLGSDDRDSAAREELAFVVYGWSRRPLFVSGGEAWALPAPVFERLAASREPFWAAIPDRGVVSDVYVLSDRGAIYAIGHPRPSGLAHLSNLAEILALAGLVLVAGLVAVWAGGQAAGRAPLSGRALLREVRSSFSRTLFLGFVAAVVVPVVALALVTRTYMAASLREDIEREATRTVISASRVVEDFAALDSRGATSLPALDDSLLVWLSRVIGEDINVFAGPGLLASSERNLFASGLLPTRTPGDTYRALVLEGRPTYLARETVGAYEYRVASALVRVDEQPAIVSVPLTLRLRGIERQVDELDRRVLLAAIAFILLGSAIGYWAAERISDPVSRLTRATRRLAAGDLSAHVLVRTSDELGRLVEAFNGMADDLRRQRSQLERTNRLEAWAEMARQVAHDIKNPLTPIQLNAEHLRRVHLDRGAPLGGIVDDCVGNILVQVRLLRQLASEFSSFASAPQARPAETALAPLIDEILGPYGTALAGRVRIAASCGPGVRVFVDPVLLARALTNVIENALHAMPGAGSLDVRVSGPDDGRVRLDVVDSGVGMDEAALARIFEPYFSTKATGTGLGLTIARRNVELNGGAIEVASTPGVGTTVTLWLPAVTPGQSAG